MRCSSRPWPLHKIPAAGAYAGLGLVPPGPQGTPDVAGAGLGANVIAITSASQNPEAAAKLPEFLVVEPDNIVQIAGLGGSIPGAILPEGHPYLESNPLAQRYLQLALEGGAADPMHPDFSENESILNVWLDELLLNGMDPHEAMDNAASEIQAEIMDLFAGRATATDEALRCCQTDANSSQFVGNGNLLGRQKTAPLCESGGTVQLEDGS